MNQKLLEQLGLAKEAGSNAMAKDFFAKTPGTGGEETSTAGPTPADGQGAGQAAQPGEPEGDELTPQMLEELLQLLAGRGQGK
jgi:hypothetical protein